MVTSWFPVSSCRSPFLQGRSVFRVAESHLSAPEAPPVVTLLAEPLHEFHTFRDQTEFVLGQQYVGRHLDVCGARLPRR